MRLLLRLYNIPQDAQLSCSVWQPSSSSSRYVSCCLESCSSVLTGSSLKIVAAAVPAQRLLQFSGRSLPRVHPTSRLRLEASLPLTALRGNTTATLSSVRWFMGRTRYYNLAVALCPEYGLLDTRARSLTSPYRTPGQHDRHSVLDALVHGPGNMSQPRCRSLSGVRSPRHSGSKPHLPLPHSETT